jgi:hypothetical protein
MLIKLDSGDYINTEAVEVIKGGDNPYIGLRSNNSTEITPTDRDRIVKAMTNTQLFDAGNQYENKEFRSEGAQRVSSTGAALIRTAIDKWMADVPEQPFADFFREARYIEANAIYRYDFPELTNVEVVYGN